MVFEQRRTASRTACRSALFPVPRHHRNLIRVQSEHIPRFSRPVGNLEAVVAIVAPGLARTDKTLEALAPERGFESVMCMSLAFRKAIGTSPGAYRRKFRSR
ncbi:MAG: helix-turn-helix transcriptional regulator [Phycisphaerae bacterium]|nr:helix-turn-helix transcriptional regulator [Phycisphaerae bacterium]